MDLLDAANDLQAVAAWGSFIVALIVGFFTIISFLQTKRIKELSSIVEELKQSNETMERRFNIEKIVNLKSSAPVFIIDHINNLDDLNAVEIFIRNVGIGYTHINTNNQSDNILSFNNTNTERSSSGLPTIRAFFKPGSDKDAYEFDIVTESEIGNSNIQRFVKIAGKRAYLVPPKY